MAKCSKIVVSAFYPKSSQMPSDTFEQNRGIVLVGAGAQLDTVLAWSWCQGGIQSEPFDPSQLHRPGRWKWLGSQGRQRKPKEWNCWKKPMLSWFWISRLSRFLLRGPIWLEPFSKSQHFWCSRPCTNVLLMEMRCVSFRLFPFCWCLKRQEDLEFTKIWQVV